MTTHASDTGQQPATDRAASTARTTKEQTRQVAGTAKEQAADVAHDAVGQARDLLAELRHNVRQQVGAQRSGLAQTLDGYAAELRQMADRSDSDGPATEAVRQIAGRLGDVRSYLEGDRDVAADVRRFARRRPGAFLLACAAVGVIAGRATRGVAAARTQAQGDSGRHVVDVREPGTSGDAAQYRTTGGEYGTGVSGTGGSGTGGGYRTSGSERLSSGADEGTPGGGTGAADGEAGMGGDYRTAGAGRGAGTGLGTGTEYGTGAPTDEPHGGIERTSDPNLRPTSGPLGGSAEGDPVAPDLGPGPTGVDEEITRAGQESTTSWERGER